MDTSARKVVIVGDSGVGKTAFRDAYVNNTFLTFHSETLGVDYQVKNGLQIWDTSSKEKSKSISKSIYYGTHCFIVLFDLTSPNSFTNLSNWIYEAFFSVKNAHFVLVGTKCDLERKITKEEISLWISKINIPYFETSAKTGNGINEVFSKVSELIREVNSKEKIAIDLLSWQISEDRTRTMNALNRICSKYVDEVVVVDDDVTDDVINDVAVDATKFTNTKEVGASQGMEEIEKLMERTIEKMMIKAMRNILARLNET